MSPGIGPHRSDRAPVAAWWDHRSAGDARCSSRAGAAGRLLPLVVPTVAWAVCRRLQPVTTVGAYQGVEAACIKSGRRGARAAGGGTRHVGALLLLAAGHHGWRLSRCGSRLSPFVAVGHILLSDKTLFTSRPCRIATPAVAPERTSAMRTLTGPICGFLPGLACRSTIECWWSTWQVLATFSGFPPTVDKVHEMLLVKRHVAYKDHLLLFLWKAAMQLPPRMNKTSRKL